MRPSRVLAVASVAVAAVTAAGPPAAADGGAYLDLDRTHYLPGQTAVATTYVSVPRGRQDVLEQGPFYAFLVTGRRWPQEGKPLPADAIRIGTFEVDHERGTAFELTAQLSIPDVPGDFYSIAVCNDPCTISGFKEPISGYISIVQTEREARLLDERQHLSGRVERLERELRKSAKELGALQAEFDARERDRAYLADEVNRLNDSLDLTRDAERRASDRADRGWAVAATAVVSLAILGLVVLVRRRRSRIPTIPDTADELVHAVDVGTKVP